MREMNEEPVQKIYKFPVTIFPSKYVIPECSYVLGCGLDPEGNPAIWYVHWADAQDMAIETVFTGEALPGLDCANGGRFNMAYSGMIQKDQLVLHVFHEGF
jgi:hypothetical protein